MDRSGFAERGFPASDPADDAFVTALIRACDPKYEPLYIQKNALRMVRTIPPDTAERLMRPLSVSPDVATRRATVAAVENMDGSGHLDVLRRLTKDSDVDVAENALRALNQALRST